MILLSLLALASASSPELDKAWAAYQDAETETAYTLVAAACEGAGSPTELAQLHHLKALVEITLGRTADADASMAEAVALAPDEAPDTRYEDALDELYRNALAARPAPAPVTSTEVAVERKRSGPNVPLLIAGSVLVASGGGTLAWALHQENAFEDQSYLKSVYGGCTYPESCWTKEREEEVRADGQQVRLFYFGGYALLGLGATLATSSFVVSATPLGSPMVVWRAPI